MGNARFVVARCAMLMAATAASAHAQGALPADPQEIPTAYPPVAQASADAPNVLLVVTDDVGFGAASTFGGPVPTPNLQKLAQRGLVYNRFHTTAMCSPTRASLLTGRNHHAVGVGALTDFPMGAPGYSGQMPKSAATIAEVLRQGGYNTAMFGKHHNVPKGPFGDAGPYDFMPTNMGFEYFFGFIGSDTDQWHPSLWRNNSRLLDQNPDKILDERLVDETIHWVHVQKANAPGKPFFAYLATGSAHTPHQAPPEWIKKFRGKFDQGWEAVREETLARQIAMGIVPKGTRLPAWPDHLPRWNDLPEKERAFQARQMEAFAAQLAFEDYQFGRLMAELDRMNLTDNTLVVFIEGDNGPDAAASPNGALAEGGEISNRRLTREEHWQMVDRIGGNRASSNYGSGWALAMSSPFPFYKSIASHLGGTRNGMVISWPEGIEGRGLRTQYGHVNDIYPTLLEAAEIATPQRVNGVEQQPVNGTSLVYSFADPAAPERHTQQYYEMLGNRAIYSRGWLAATVPQRNPWEMAVGAGSEINKAPSYTWQLFHLDKDFNQTHDLAADEPAKLADLKAAFASQADANHVNPINDRTDFGRIDSADRAYTRRRDRYVYWGGDLMIPVSAAPALGARAFKITADITGGSGVLVAYGSGLGGWSFSLDDGRPAIHHAMTLLPQDQTALVAPQPIEPGRQAKVEFDFDYDGGGIRKGGVLTISVDGHKVAEKRLEQSIVRADPHSESFDIGLDSGVPVFETPGSNRFTGQIEKVVIELGAMGQKRVTPR